MVTCTISHHAVHHPTILGLGLGLGLGGELRVGVGVKVTVKVRARARASFRVSKFGGELLHQRRIDLIMT